MKKTATRLSLELDPTPDILAEVGQKKGDRLLIGFAAETQNLIEEARRKLTRRTVTWWSATSSAGTTSDSDRMTTKSCWFSAPAKPCPFLEPPSAKVADAILDQAQRLRLALHSQAAP